MLSTAELINVVTHVVSTVSTDVHIESKSVLSGRHNQLCATNAVLIDILIIILIDTDVRLQRERLIFIAKRPSFTHLIYK